MLEAWSSFGSLEDIVGEVARALRATPLAPSRVSMVVLPVFGSLDGTQWIWSAYDPHNVKTEIKPYGFLDSAEHRESVMHKVLTTGQAVRYRLATGATGFSFLDSLIDSGATDYLVMPLPVRHAAPSVFSLVTDRPGGWAEDDLASLRQLTPVLSLLIEVAETERLLQLAGTDPLTGLANRRSFEWALRQSWALCQRSSAPLSLLYFDVDHFKTYNDTYGHPAGDDCLVKVSRAAAASVGQRATDLIARVGGEEFAALLPTCSRRGAFQAAEHLRASVEQLAIPHQHSTVSACVTVSVGAVTVEPEAVVEPRDLIAIADSAMYKAKAAGRNQVAFGDLKG